MIHSLSLFEPAFDCETRIFGNKEGIMMEKDRRALASQVEEQNSTLWVGRGNVQFGWEK